MTSVMDRTGARLLTRTLLALVLLAGPAGSEARAAIAFVQNVGVDGNTVPGTSVAVTLHGNTNVAVGDTVIVTFVMDPSAGAVSCADSGGNSYSLDADVTKGSVTSGVRTVIFSAFVNTALGNQDTITVTHPLHGQRYDASDQCHGRDHAAQRAATRGCRRRDEEDRIVYPRGRVHRPDRLLVGSCPRSFDRQRYHRSRVPDRDRDGVLRCGGYARARAPLGGGDRHLPVDVRRRDARSR